MCCVAGSELLVGTCTGEIRGEEDNMGLKTSRRRGQKPCKEKRRMRKARVQRGRKSEGLPD
jgi:hypothetical protein